MAFIILGALAVLSLLAHEVMAWRRPAQGAWSRDGRLPTHTPSPLFRPGGDQAHRPTSGHPHGANDVRDVGPRLPQTSRASRPPSSPYVGC